MLPSAAPRIAIGPKHFRVLWSEFRLNFSSLVWKCFSGNWVEPHSTFLSDATYKQANEMELFWWYLFFLLEGTSISIANIITTVIFWRRRSALKRAAYLLINLALADILVGLAVISIGATAVTATKFSLYGTEAKVVTAPLFLGFTASICSLAVIAVERAFAINKPMRHRTAPTAYYWRGLSLVWIIAALTTTIMSIRSVFLQRDLVELQYVVAAVYLVLLFFVCLSYCSILWATSRRSPALRQRDLQNRKLASTLFIVTFFSLATGLPGVTATIIPKEGMGSINTDGFFTLVLLQFLNSLINPFVYALRMPEFRREFKRLCAGLTVNWPRSREEVIPMADVGARAVTLRSVETLVRPTSALHTGISTGAEEN